MNTGSAGWHVLTGADLPEIAELAGRVLAADGGLPMAADLSFLTGRYAGPAVVTRGVRDGDGVLVAAGAVRPGPEGSVASGMVDPRARHRGLGAALLDWALATAAGPVAATPRTQAAEPARITVETESLTPQAAELFASRGLRQVFAEDVLRHDLADPLPGVALPAGVRLEPWSAETAPRFFQVYASAFAERPNFPGWSAAQWLDWLTGDDEFRPEHSLLAVDRERGDVAFITCAAGWIVQVGVRPDRRGRRLGAGLVVEALGRMRAAGEREVLLDVSVDNPAGALYRRLGFELVGRRARFAVQSGGQAGPLAG